MLRCSKEAFPKDVEFEGVIERFGLATTGEFRWRTHKRYQVGPNEHRMRSLGDNRNIQGSG